MIASIPDHFPVVRSFGNQAWRVDNYLLPEHDQPSSAHSLKVVLGPQDVPVLRSFANPDVTLLLCGQVGEVSCKSSTLEQALGFDLFVLDLYELVIRRDLSKQSKGLDCLFVAALFDEPARREWQPPDPDRKNGSWNTLDDGR